MTTILYLSRWYVRGKIKLQAISQRVAVPPARNRRGRKTALPKLFGLTSTKMTMMNFGEWAKSRLSQ